MLSRSLARACLVRAALPRRAVLSKALTPIRPLPITAHRLIAPISMRGYAAAAVRQVETESDDFFADSIPPASPPTETFTPAIPAAASAPSAPSAPVGVPFTSIKGRIDHDTFKALTFKPFKLTAMSEVQRRVMELMPFLAGGKMRGPAREAAEAEGRSIEPEEGSREDLLVKAKTGTGKTIAFLVPALDARIHTLEKLADAHPLSDTNAKRGLAMRELTRSTVGALIISPTRELATQIANEATKLCTWHKEFQVQLLVGGGSRMGQLKDWKRGRKDVVVATPGRLKDLLDEPVVADAIATTDLLILDEADTLLEMGFAKELNYIIDQLPKERQTFLFSATVSPQIAQIARESLKPKHQVIDCVPKNESNTHAHIPQFYTVLDSAAQQVPHVLRILAQDLIQKPDSKSIVFLNTTKQTMLFATLLRELNDLLPSRMAVHEIHSKLDQRQRSRASERFRRDRMPSVLVTSDVSARGVDYPGVTRVIQIGIPSTPEQYIHRVGRTGRAGGAGRGDLVLLPWEGDYVKSLRGVPIKPVTVDDLQADLTENSTNMYLERLEAMDQRVAEFLPTLDPEAVEEVFMSLLGFYASKTEDLRVGHRQVLDGLKEWAVGGGGLDEAPHVSSNMLAKLGMTERKLAGRSFGSGSGSRGGSRFGRSGFRSGGGFRGDSGSRGGFGSRDGYGSRDDGGSRGGYGSRNDGGSRGGYVSRDSGGSRSGYGSRDDGGFRGGRAGGRY
ncbi:hypothetical protein JCM24511_05420 [Saitozyma sp. JCM 24511]|nr:hypothetical protein JCM24511_05420 [Saitozyma sp. JCM 24511]